MLRFALFGDLTTWDVIKGLRVCCITNNGERCVDNHTSTATPRLVNCVYIGLLSIYVVSNKHGC